MSASSANPPLISVYDAPPAAYPRISTNDPAVIVDGFHHIAVACSDIAKSKEFYSKIGFATSSSADHPTICVMKNRGGLSLHLSTCDQGIEDDKNLLMDYATNKYPGHTHASFTVPNVAAAQTYIESQGIAISGDRTRAGKLYAVFARDPDRTTLEFEKNHGEPEDVVVTGDMIGYPQCMDHVGIRVCDADEALVWYAETLGFNLLVNKYERNPDPLKNFPPWIARTPTADPAQPNCDINFIVNGNERPTENILWAGGRVRPGILAVGFTVSAPLGEVEARLRAQGVSVVHESALGASKWACLQDKVVLNAAHGGSLFLEDREGSLLRLWPSSA